MNTKKRLLLWFCAATSVAQGANASDNVVFQDYQIQVHVESRKGENQRVRLPKSEADAFLSMFARAAGHLEKCEEYQQSARNPLIRRVFEVKIAPDRFGCSVEISEYGVHAYACKLSMNQAQALSNHWRLSSQGPALGARTSEEQALLSEACDLQ